MEYICFHSNYNPLDHFWKRLLNMLATYQHSKYQHRQSGREHIEMEDQTMVNILRLDSTIIGTNHRYLLNGLKQLFNKLKKDKVNDNDNDDDNDKEMKDKPAINMLLKLIRHWICYWM